MGPLTFGQQALRLTALARCQGPGLTIAAAHPRVSRDTITPVPYGEARYRHTCAL